MIVYRGTLSSSSADSLQNIKKETHRLIPRPLQDYYRRIEKLKTGYRHQKLRSAKTICSSPIARAVVRRERLQREERRGAKGRPYHPLGALLHSCKVSINEAADGGSAY